MKFHLIALSQFCCLIFPSCGPIIAQTIPVSPATPGGLAPSNTPQFICITFDDSVNPTSYDQVQQITDHKNPDGAPVPCTFFVCTVHTEYWLVHRLHAAGHEIAVHTMTHTTGSDTDFMTWIREIAGCREALSRYASIPVEDIRGFRAPFLEFGPEQYAALDALGFDYDTSAIEQPGLHSANGASYIWPYTLHDGIQQKCWTGISPTNCHTNLVEIPIWCLLDGEAVHGMDPPGSHASLLSLFKTNLLERYNGNRVPLGIWLHPAWLEDDGHCRALNEFLDWALAKPDVRCASLSMVHDWMRSPAPASAVATNKKYRAQTYDPVPEEESEFCVFNGKGFRTSGARPPVYPKPATAFMRCISVEGPTVDIVLKADWGSGFQADIVIQHSQPQPLRAWTLDLDPGDCEIGSLWGAADHTIEDDQVKIFPGNNEAFIAAGKTVVASFTATGAFEELGSAQGAFYIAGYESPRLTPGMHGNTCILRWNRCAAGYVLQKRSHLSAGEWGDAGTFYGQCETEIGLPTNTTYYRIDAVY